MKIRQMRGKALAAATAIAALASSFVASAPPAAAGATGTTTLATFSRAGTQGNNTSQVPAISADGRIVAIESLASNFIPGDTNGSWDIFVRDRVAGTTERVSVATDESQANSNSHRPALSGDGRYVAFISLASNLVPGDTNGTYDVFVRDRLAGTTERVSISTEGAQANATSLHGGLNVLSISRDGRYVAFHSAASNMVLGDQCCWDIFIRDRVAGTTRRISNPAGGQANNDSHDPAISADGRFVAYRSAASNITEGDTCCWDIFVYDGMTGSTERVSVDAAGAQANNDSHMPSITPDGRYVAFYSIASTLVPLDLNGTWDVFVKDRTTGAVERISVSRAGDDSNATSANDSPPRISDDGRYVTFESAASNLVLGDSCCWDAFVRDRVTSTTRRVSVPSGGGEGNNDSLRPAISADGGLVVFQSAASNLVSGDVNGQWDVFVHDLAAGTTELATLSSSGILGNSTSSSPAVSADGRFVAYRSAASNLVPGDTNGTWDVFVFDRQARTTERASVATGGAQANSTSDQFGPPAISADGRTVAFRSLASNLVPGDTCCWDIFVRDLAAGTTTRASVTSSGVQANNDSHSPALSADGRVVAFHSFASNLVAGDTNGTWDVFARDLQAGTTERVSVDSAGAQANASSDQSGPASLSGDGRLVAFRSSASNLVAADTCCWDAFVRDRQAGTTRRVSLTSGGVQANNDSHSPRISADGRVVAFYSIASNLVPGDTNGAWDVFAHDLASGGTARVSIDSSGAQANGHSDQDLAAAISDDGCSIAFRSGASNLVAGDTNGLYDIFVHDCVRTSIAYAGGTSAFFAEPLAATATLTDASGSPLAGETVTFEILDGGAAVRSATATTDSSGVASASVPTDVTPGDYRIRVRNAGSVLVGSATDEEDLAVLERPTNLSAPAPASGFFGERVTVSATLTDVRADAPLGGKDVLLELGNVSELATTGSDGVATVEIDLDQQPGPYTLAASFAGGGGLAAAVSTTEFELASRPTSLIYAGPVSGRPGRNAELSATLADVRAASPLVGEPVSFTLGAFTIEAITDGDGTARAQAPLDQEPGDYELVVSFAGRTTQDAAEVRVPFVIGWPYTFRDGDGLGIVYLDPEAREFQVEAGGVRSGVKHDDGMQVISLPEGIETPTPEPLPTITPPETPTPEPLPSCIDDPTGGPPFCPADFLPPIPTTSGTPTPGVAPPCAGRGCAMERSSAADASLCDLPQTQGCAQRLVVIAFHDDEITLTGTFDLQSGAFAAAVVMGTGAHVLRGLGA